MNALSGLRDLNFRRLIRLSGVTPSAYSFGRYREQGHRHPDPAGFCISCETKKLHTARDGSGFRLRNMSHGAHSEDFLDALSERPETSEWRQDAVVFVFETPSANRDGLYETHEHRGFRKRPARQWYWVHGDQDFATYPRYFQGATYGELILSLITTFRLANAYTTNLVKCGLNRADGEDYKGLSSFRPACIENCYQEFLSRELELLQPSVVFAFGAATEDWLCHLLPESTYVQQLPHPAGRRRGFRDEHYKVLYFWLVARALHAAGLLPVDEARVLGEQFLSEFDRE